MRRQTPSHQCMQLEGESSTPRRRKRRSLHQTAASRSSARCWQLRLRHPVAMHDLRLALRRSQGIPAYPNQLAVVDRNQSRFG